MKKSSGIIVLYLIVLICGFALLSCSNPAGGSPGNTDNSGGNSDPAKTIVYVTLTGAGSKDGTSWNNAMNNVQEAIEAAFDYGLSEAYVFIEEGTYYPTSYPNLDESTLPAISKDRYKHFSLRNNVTVIGGFKKDAGETSPSLGNAATILSGDIGISGDNTDNVFHVFYHPQLAGLTGQAELWNCQITGGKADDSSGYNFTSHNFGGGMYNNGCNPTINDCVFSYNEANSSKSNSYGGGGMYNENCNLIIKDCVFLTNEAKSGGGIYNKNSDIRLNGCSFNNNNAKDEWGGGIYNESGSIQIVDCQFLSNLSNQGGGAIANFTCTAASVEHSIFDSNFVKYYSGGGAIYSYSSNSGIFDIDNCIFNNNNVETSGGSTQGGGAVHCNRLASLSVKNCSFGNNKAGSKIETGKGDGGGMLLNNVKNTTIINCTFSENIAKGSGGSDGGDGGGLYLFNSKVTIINSTFSGNKTEKMRPSVNGGKGGGIAMWQGTVSLYGTIIAGNVAVYGNNEMDLIMDSGTVSGSHNLIGGTDDEFGAYGKTFTGTIDKIFSRTEIVDGVLTAMLDGPGGSPKYLMIKNKSDPTAGPLIYVENKSGLTGWPSTAIQTTDQRGYRRTSTGYYLGAVDPEGTIVP